jgi:hypothetical protein
MIAYLSQNGHFCSVQANEVWNGSLTDQTGLMQLHETRGSLILSQKQATIKKQENKQQKRLPNNAS